MTDFITLQCPNCGGSLEIGNNILALRCEHCGMEHLVRHADEGIILESHARCPVCSRNDRAEKVSAILRAHKHNIEGITYQNQTTFVKVGDQYRPRTEKVEVPMKSTQVSDLAAQLVPPPKPVPPRLFEPSSTNIVLVILAIILFLAMGACLFMVSVLPLFGLLQNEINSLAPSILFFACFVLPAVLFIGVGVLLWRVQLPRMRTDNETRRINLRADYHQAKEQYDQKVSRWETAMQRWEDLYYCGRDDCVFIPGAGSSAPLADLKAYLYS